MASRSLGPPRGIRYSAGLLLAAREITDGLTRRNVRRASQRIQYVVGVSLAAIGFNGAVSGVVTAIDPRPGPGITGSIAVTCAALSMLCVGIGVASGRPRAFPAIGACLTGIAAFVAFYLDQGGVSNLVYAAIFFLVPLSGVVVAPWIRSHRRQARVIHYVLYPGCTECFPAKTTGQGQGPTPVS
jgi:hypothetical protein